MEQVLSKLLFITAPLLIMLAVIGVILPSQAYAQNTTPWTGVCIDNSNPDVGDVATIQGIECLVGNFLSIAVTAVGIAAFVMFLVGSLLYLTSGGNPKGTEAGQKTITFAIIGVVVSLTGFIALNFISTFTGVQSIQTFTLDSENTQPPQSPSP